MNGIHDMGGMHGFGPIAREADEPLFHHDWERRVFAMRQVTPIPIPGGSRNNIEQMDPADYLRTSYYEKWLHSALKGFMDAGALSADEFAAKVVYYQAHPEAEVPRREDPQGLARAQERLRRPLKSPRRDLPLKPQFAVGASVRVRNLHPAGHTRLPRYVRGKPGQVARYYGIYDLQDAMPAGSDAPPQPLYAVRFDARALWGDAAEAKSVVYLDMWESYLEGA